VPVPRDRARSVWAGGLLIRMETTAEEASCSNGPTRPAALTRGDDTVIPSCLVAERCWDRVRYAIEEYTWRFDGLRPRAPRRRRT
jgi:hypothetical protein